MANINGKDIRELWAVKFLATSLVKGDGGVLERQNAEVLVRVWALTGDEAIDIVRKHPPKGPAGPLVVVSFTGLEQIGLLESHIMNQPKAELPAQPYGIGSGLRLPESLPATDGETGPATEAEAPQDGKRGLSAVEETSTPDDPQEPQQ